MCLFLSVCIYIYIYIYIYLCVEMIDCEDDNMIEICRKLYKPNT